MVKKKTWQEFRKTGLLWFMNTILHAFGWAIVVEVERGEILIHASKKPYSQVRKILPTKDRRYIEDLLHINRVNGQEHVPTGVIVGKGERE